MYICKYVLYVVTILVTHIKDYRNLDCSGDTKIYNLFNLCRREKMKVIKYGLSAKKEFSAHELSFLLLFIFSQV